MGVFVAGVPSSLAPRAPFFSRVLAHTPLPRLRLLRRLSTCRERGTKLVLTKLVFRNLYCIAPLGRSGNGPLPLRKVFESGDLRPFDAKACVSQKPREFMGPEKEAS